MSGQPTGVLLVNLGGPADESSVGVFIYRLLADRCVVDLPFPWRHLLARTISTVRTNSARAHYRHLGGKSPIDQETKGQRDALAAALGPGYAVDYAFRHSPPFIDEALESPSLRGANRVICVPTFPQWCRSTSESTEQAFVEAAARKSKDTLMLGSFPDAPGFIEAICASIMEQDLQGAHVILSAHGVPLSLVKRGDPYVREVERTVEAIKAKLPSCVACTLAFQSRLGPVRWTQPALLELLQELATSGVRRVIVAPISFVCENLETLYELDIEVAQHARQLGIEEYHRVATPGASRAFIAELASRVRQAAQTREWENTP